MQHTYIFIGLTPTERSLLQSLFALGQEEGEQLLPVRRPEDAHLIVVNGDDPAVVARLRTANPRALVVLVGEPVGYPVGGLPILHRPLRVPAVVEVLSRLDWPDSLPGRERTVATGGQAQSSRGTDSSHASLLSHAPTLAPTTASMRLPTNAGAATQGASLVSARAAWASSEQASLPLTPRRTPTAPEAGDGAAQTFRAVDAVNDADVMVVVGGIGQRSYTLPRGLRRLGFQVRLVEGPQAAQAAFGEGPVPFIFLDQSSLGADLLPLARWMSARRAAPDEPPHVVVVARRRSVFEHLRARMAGCHWMAVPLDRGRLLSYFAQRGLQPGPVDED